MNCQRNLPEFCQGEAVGTIEGGENICNGCREFNEPFLKKFND